MSKPVPKHEIIISEGNPLIITTASPDAYQWIKREAPQFGNYYEPTFERYHTLFVDETYDIGEVAAYLAKMGDDQ